MPSSDKESSVKEREFGLESRHSVLTGWNLSKVGHIMKTEIKFMSHQIY